MRFKWINMPLKKKSNIKDCLKRVAALEEELAIIKRVFQIK